MRLWVNGVLLIDKWIDEAPTEWSGAIALTAGQKYDVRMDYYENGGGAAAQLRWSSASQAKEIVPQTQLYRPKPILASIANQSVAVGNALTLTATTTDWDQVAGATLFEDFESYPDGSASDIIMFRKPGNSATTSGFLDSGLTNYTASTGSFPGGHASSRVRDWGHEVKPVAARSVDAGAGAAEDHAHLLGVPGRPANLRLTPVLRRHLRHLEYRLARLRRGERGTRVELGEPLVDRRLDLPRERIVRGAVDVGRGTLGAAEQVRPEDVHRARHGQDGERTKGQPALHA